MENLENSANGFAPFGYAVPYSSEALDRQVMDESLLYQEWVRLSSSTLVNHPKIFVRFGDKRYLLTLHYSDCEIPQRLHETTDF